MPASPRREYARAYAASHHSAHLIPEGSRRALCGAKPRDDRRWLGNGDRHATRLASLPDCPICASRARVAAAIATWDGPPQRAGVIARIDCGTYMGIIGACARCDQVRHLPCRGLCPACLTASRLDGTLAEYGWTYADRLAEYAQMRANRVARAECARRLGVCDRTATRYEKALADAGQAPWRHAP